MRRLAALAATLLAAGCASKAPEPARAPPRARVAAPPPAVPVVSPATYVAQAASIDLFVVRSSELALVRSPSRSVRDFASRMIETHHGTAAQLSFAGRRLNLLPPATLLPREQALLDQLETSGTFDQTYRRLQLQVHGASLALHSQYSRAGTSPTLRPVAANAEAVERGHLELLRRL